jgi:hypothetical protein
MGATGIQQIPEHGQGGVDAHSNNMLRYLKTS